MFTRARLVLAGWFTLALIVTLAVIGGVAYALIRRDIDREIDDSLASAQSAIAAPPTGFSRPNDPRPGPGDRPGPSVYDTDRIPAGIPSDVFIVYSDGSGNVTGNPREVDVGAVNFGGLCSEAVNGKALNNVSADGGHYRFISEKIADGQWIHLGRSLEARDRQLRTLTIVFGVGGVGGVLAAAVGGVWLAGLALRPIRQSFERQRQFVSDASHELRTPLAVMRANGELLERHPEQSIGDNMPQVEAITAEAEAMTKLVEDLLTLARADEGRGAMAHEPVELDAVIEDLARDMTALAGTRGIELNTELRPARLEGDRLRLRQLGAILVDNALKYTPRGGTVSLRTATSGKSVELVVSDTGPGIPVEEQGRIFDRFVRIDSARTRAAGGTGLGLAIAKWITEAHGGRIGVESHPGHGAKFTVRLPAAD
jgi:signal transduction histidine kinase